MFNADPFDHAEINRLIGNFDLAPEMTQSVLDFFGDCLREPPVEEPPLPPITISPNPASDYLTVQTHRDYPITLQFFNDAGRPIATRSVRDGQMIYVARLRPGTYVLQFTDEESGDNESIRLLKE